MSAPFEADELRELEQRLTERLETIAPRPRLAAGERLRMALAATPQRHGLVPWLSARWPHIGWTRTASLAAVAVAALAVGLSLGGIGLFAAGKSPAPSPSGIGPDSFGKTWQQVPVDQAGGRRVIGGFLGSRRSVLTGEMPGPRPSIAGLGPAAWYSDDLMSWHRSTVVVADTTAISVQDLGPVFQSGDRLVAMGRAYEMTGYAGRGSPPRLSVPFTSTDGGATWVQATEGTPASDGWVVDVVAGGPGYVAVGESGTHGGLRIWTSTDGLAWELVDPTQLALQGDGTLFAVAEHDGTLMAVGRIGGSDPTGPETDVVLVSRDGTHWNHTALSHPIQAVDITWFDGAWIATGVTMSRSTDDGNTWTAVDLQGIRSGWPFGTSSVGVAVVADRVDQSGVATSTDGVKWDWHSLNPNQPPWNAVITVLLARDGQLLAAGNAPESDSPPVAWVSGAASTSSPAPTPTTTPTPAVPTSTHYSSWTAVPMPDPTPHAFSGEWPYAAVEFRGQVIAAGGINGSCCTGTFSTDTRAVVWRTTDMKTWQLEPDRPDFALGHMTGIATDGRVLMAVGSTALESTSSPGEITPVGAVWRSTDGVSWARIPGTGIFSGIAWFRDRFYAVAQPQVDSGLPFSPGIWSSRNGSAWSLMRRIDGDLLMAIRATPLGLVAVGGNTTSAGGPVIWFSTDGSRWIRSTVPGGPQETVTDVAGSASTLMAIGLGDTGGPAVWVSDDGVSWAQTVDDFMLGGLNGPQLARIIWAGDEFLALGVGDIGGTSIGFRAMTSRDGTQWSLVSPASAFESSTGQITDAIRLSTGNLLVLAAGDGDGGHHGVPLSWLVTR
jgi:hypothetical protein